MFSLDKFFFFKLKLAALRTIEPINFREPQPLNSRPVYKSASFSKASADVSGLYRLIAQFIAKLLEYFFGPFNW